MFKKDKPYQNIESIIAAGVEIKGDIISQSSIRVDGVVDGKINIKGDLILGEKGHIKGDINISNIIVAGTVEGTIKADGRLEITASGKIYGDIACSTLSIEEGGILQGSSQMAINRDGIDTSTLFKSKRNQRQDS